MKVFISWSGERSEALAKALREWFPLVLHFVDPWLSQSDIEAGERWSVEVAKGLESCNFGIICVARDNINSPWILFEAGALAKSMQDGRVIPLLVDLEFKEISGPLAQFQSKKAEKAGIKELIVSLNKAGQESVPEAQLNTLFEALWPKLESDIQSLPKPTSVKQVRNQGEILEELVASIRNMELRLRDTLEDGAPPKRKRRDKYNSMMMMDIMHGVGETPYDPVTLLFVSSTFKDEHAWISELCKELYTALKSGNLEEAGSLQKKLLRALEILQSGPAREMNSHELGETIYILRDLLASGHFIGHAQRADIRSGLKPDKAAKL